MYKTIELITEVKYEAKDRKERNKTLNFLKTEYPVGSVIGVQIDNEVKEIWILEWNSVKVNDKYIVGGRGLAVDSNQEYILKPVIE